MIIETDGGQAEMLERAARSSLVDELLLQFTLPPSMRTALDNLLNADPSPDASIQRAVAAVGGRRRLIMMAIMAYMGVGQPDALADCLLAREVGSDLGMEAQ